MSLTRSYESPLVSQVSSAPTSLMCGAVVEGFAHYVEGVVGGETEPTQDDADGTAGD